MAQSLETFPVTKNGKFFGYADARQIAANPSLELYDERKAAVIEAEQKVAAAKADQEKKAASVENAKSAGADASAVKKAADTK